MNQQVPSLLKLCVAVIVKLKDREICSRLSISSSVPAKLANIIASSALKEDVPITEEFCRIYFNQNVTKLDLQHRSPKRDYSTLLCHVMNSCPNLIELYIPGWNDRETLIKVMDQIQCRYLQRLDISGIDENIMWSAIFKELPYLEQLKANGTIYFDDECLKTLVLAKDEETADDTCQSENYAQNFNLTLLHLSGNSVTHKAMDYVARCPNLANLNLAGKVSLDYHSIKKLTKCTNLDSIDFTGCARLSGEAIVEFCLNHTRLTSVNLSSNRQVTVDGVMEIVRGLKHSLQRFSIGWHKNLTTGDALRMINLCSNLQYLNLIGCHKVNVEQVSEYVSHLTYLSVVGFKKTQVKKNAKK
jgi:hypothetical protein